MGGSSPLLDLGTLLSSESGSQLVVHLVLLGDSIFDNAVYVPDEPCLSAQVGSQRQPVGINNTFQVCEG